MENIKNLSHTCVNKEGGNNYLVTDAGDSYLIKDLVDGFNYLSYNIFHEIIILTILSFLFIVFIKYQKINIKLSLLFYLYNFLITIFFIYYSLFNPSDAKTYYFLAYHNISCDYFTNSYSYNNIIILIKGLLYIFDFSYISLTLIFSFFGMLFHLKFYVYLTNILNKKISKLLIYPFLFLPSINFFISSISKEVIIYCSIILIITSFSYKPIKLIFFLIGVILILLFRPYVLFLFLLSFIFISFIYLIFTRKLHFLIPLIVSFLAIYFFGDLFLHSIDFKYSFNINSLFINLYEKNQIIIQNQNLYNLLLFIFKSFTLFILSPIFYDFNSFFSKVYFFETSYFLLIFVLTFYLAFKIPLSNFRFMILTLFLFIILYIIAVSLVSVNNIGLIVRYKIIIFPILLIILINLQVRK